MTREPIALASDYDRRLAAFWGWNGDLPAPQFSHWMSGGSFVIRASTPGRPPITEVLYAGKRLGFGGYPPRDAENLAKGSYDKELGFKASERGPPADLAQWNNLGD